METMMEGQDARINPWLWIWFKPRAAMRHILRTDSSYRVFTLGALGGMAQAFDQAIDSSLGDTWSFPAVLLLCVIGGGIMGALSLFPVGALYRWVGSWFGGKGSSEEVRAALAWSYMPSILTILLLIPMLLLFGEALFQSDGDFGLNPVTGVLVLGLVAASLILLIWRIVLFILCLAEAHEVSGWKGLAISVVGALIVGIPVWVFSLL